MDAKGVSAALNLNNATTIINIHRMTMSNTFTTFQKCAAYRTQLCCPSMLSDMLVMAIRLTEFYKYDNNEEVKAKSLVINRAVEMYIGTLQG